MRRAQIDDAAAAEEPPYAAADLPRLVELLARQAPGAANGSRDAVEERGAGESFEITLRQPTARRR